MEGLKLFGSIPASQPPSLPATIAQPVSIQSTGKSKIGRRTPWESGIKPDVYFVRRIVDLKYLLKTTA
jgi:hypothetical protein